MTTEVDGRPFLGGRVDLEGAQTFAVVSPVDGREIGRFVECGPDVVDRAVADARSALGSARWRSPRERKTLLRRWAQFLREAGEEIARVQTWEMGRPVALGRIDVAIAADTIDWFADLADKVYGETISYQDGNQALVVREPVGVVGAVVPWSFPVGMATWKFAPVLAMGNAIVLKPAEQSPFSVLLMADLALEAGIPAGVVNILPGRGSVTGEAIGLHQGIAAVTFTGSTKVGKRFLDYAARSNMKQVWLETGGKSAAIVLADADIARAGELIAAGLVRNTGQVCSANGRVLVDAKVADKFREHLERALRTHHSRDPFEEGTQMGPLASPEHYARVRGMVSSAIEAGEKPSVGSVPTSTDSHYFDPVAFWGVGRDSRLWREEVFGPVLTVRTFSDVADAIEEANDTSYGLAGSVFSGSLEAALDVAHRLDVGSVTINDVDQVDVATPFGGRKESGNAADLSIHSAHKFTALKTIWIKGTRT